MTTIELVQTDVAAISATEASIETVKAQLTVSLTKYVNEFNGRANKATLSNLLTVYVLQFNQLTVLCKTLAGQVQQLRADATVPGRTLAADKGRFSVKIADRITAT